MFASFFLCVWNQMPWRNLLTIVLPRNFCTNTFDYSTDCQNLWCCGSIYPKTILIFLKNVLNCRVDTIEKQSIINLSRIRCKSYGAVVLRDSLVNFLKEEEDVVYCPSVYCILFMRAIKWLYLLNKSCYLKPYNFV